MNSPWLHVGHIGDGGKWLCDPHRIKQLHANRSQSACVIMSIGSNNDFSFEESMHATFDSLCTIHTFDHTVKDPTPPEYVHYHALGLGQHRVEKLRPLSSLVELATGGNALARVEVLKIDVEGRQSRVCS